MGKSLKGKELGKGITQRKDGIYQGRFVNRFGERRTVYANSLKEIREKLRDEEYEDDKCINIVHRNMTLDEWYEIWMETCKKNCRESTKATYAGHYRRIQKELGWRKLSELNLIVMQQVFNELGTDNERKNSKKILVDMMEKAIDSDLLIKNTAKQINAVISKEPKKERRVLTREETELFLAQAEDTFYYNLYVLALETGMRIGELTGLRWDDVDFNRKVLYVRRTLSYFQKDGQYIFEWHDTKTHNGRRTIPLTSRAIAALKKQRLQQKTILLKHASEVSEEYRDLVFATKTGQPTQTFIVKECIELTVKQLRQQGHEFESFSAQCFRHTFATRAIENGVTPKTLQRLLGHGSLMMTMDLYCHVTDDTLFEAMELMEKMV